MTCIYFANFKIKVKEPRISGRTIWTVIWTRSISIKIFNLLTWLIRKMFWNYFCANFDILFLECDSYFSHLFGKTNIERLISVTGRLPNNQPYIPQQILVENTKIFTSVIKRTWNNIISTWRLSVCIPRLIDKF